MIVVRVELWPGGNYREKRDIASAFISNISGPDPISDYRAEVRESASDVTGLPDTKAVIVLNGHDRRTSVWWLISQVARIAAKRVKDAA